MKRKTNKQLKQENRELKRKLETHSTTNVVSNCNFETKVWDAKAVEAVQTVATALLNLTEVFKAQNITIGPLIHIGTQDRTLVSNVHAKNK